MKDKTYGNLVTKEYLNSVIKIVLESDKRDKRDEKFIAEIEKRIEQAEKKLKEQVTALYFEDIEK